MFNSIKARVRKANILFHMAKSNIVFIDFFPESNARLHFVNKQNLGGWADDCRLAAAAELVEKRFVLVYIYVFIEGSDFRFEF